MKFDFYLTGCFFCWLAMSGCSNNDFLENTNLELGEKALMTMQTSGPQTRVNYTDIGTSMTFSWSSGDATSVFVNGVAGNENCKLTTNNAAKNAVFSGTVTPWRGTKHIYAFYPYSATRYNVVPADDGTKAMAFLDLPNPQSYTIDGPISNSFMVGVGTASASGSTIDASVSFKQMMSIIKLNISNAHSKVVGVKLKCTESVFPTTVTVEMSDGTILHSGALVNELSLNVTDDTSDSDKAVYFAMFPADLTGKTITLDVIFEGGLIKTINKLGRLFKRNNHYVVALDAAGADPAIEINGLTWATGNLVADGPNGAKIGTPADNGLYFQFGSLVGWSETGAPTLAVAPADFSRNTSWNKLWTGDPTIENTAAGTGDPCKYYLGGTWRLPTKDEYNVLFFNKNFDWSSATSWSWASSTASAQHTSGLTFLASGYLDPDDGRLVSVSSSGLYWSSSSFNENTGCYLDFDSYNLDPNSNSNNAFGFPVRCVRD